MLSDQIQDDTREAIRATKQQIAELEDILNSDPPYTEKQIGQLVLILESDSLDSIDIRLGLDKSRFKLAELEKDLRGANLAAGAICTACGHMLAWHPGHDGRCVGRTTDGDLRCRKAGYPYPPDQCFCEQFCDDPTQGEQSLCKNGDLETLKRMWNNAKRDGDVARAGRLAEALAINTNDASSKILQSVQDSLVALERRAHDQKPPGGLESTAPAKRVKGNSHRPQRPVKQYISQIQAFALTRPGVADVDAVMKHLSSLGSEMPGRWQRKTGERDAWQIWQKAKQQDSLNGLRNTIRSTVSRALSKARSTS